MKQNQTQQDSAKILENNSTKNKKSSCKNFFKKKIEVKH
jgi:hypothetical protein